MNNSAQQNLTSTEIISNSFLKFTKESNQSYFLRFLNDFWQRFSTIYSAGFYIPLKYVTGKDTHISPCYLNMIHNIGANNSEYVMCIYGLDDVNPGKNSNNLQTCVKQLNNTGFADIMNSLAFLSQAIDNQLQSTQIHIGSCLQCFHQEYMQIIDGVVFNFSKHILHTKNRSSKIISYYNNLATILLGLYHILDILLGTAENVNRVFDIDTMKYVEGRCREFSIQHPWDFMRAHFGKLSFTQKKAMITIYDLMQLFTDYVKRNFEAYLGGKGL